MYMRKFYETKPVLFAVLWIVVYVVLIAPLRGNYGDGSLQMLLGLVAISGALLAVIRLLGIEKELGMTRWLQNGKALLWLLPMWVLSTGNLWGGVHDLAVLENADVPILSFQSVHDPVMPYDFGYPLGFAGRLMSDPVYGTHAIYEKAVSIGLRAEHHPCEEARHRLHLDDALEYTPRFYEIRDAMVQFFAEVME